MARTFVLSNSKTLACLDKYSQIKDLYYPSIGLENHVLGNTHKIGVWVDELLGKVTIIKKGSGYIIEKKYKDGSGSTEDLIGYKVREKPAFKEKGNTSGEYYVIEKSGGLGVYDSLGLITTMRAIK